MAADGAGVKRRERLDVPVASPLERLLASSTSPRQKPQIGPVAKSQVLGKLKAFLPAMAAANEQLSEQAKAGPVAELDIESNVDESRPYIEMDLACGVLDLHDDSSLQAAERAMREGPGPGGVAGNGGDDDDCSDDSDDDSGEEAGAGHTGGSKGTEPSGALPVSQDAVMADSGTDGAPEGAATAVPAGGSGRPRQDAGTRRKGAAKRQKKPVIVELG